MCGPGRFLVKDSGMRQISDSNICRRVATVATRIFFASAILFSRLDSSGFSIKPGDILVAEDGSGSVVKIDPDTGAQTSFGKFSGAHDIELSPDGFLYVLEHARIVTKLNVLTGERSTLTSLGLLGTDAQDTFVTGLTLGPSGDVFVTVYASPYTGVVRVNHLTGQQTLLASGGMINGPIGIALAPNGKLVVGDVSNNSIIEVDTIDGSQRRIASGLPAGSPWYLAVASDGAIYAGKDYPSSGNLIQKIDPRSGSHTVFASGGNLAEPRGIALDLNGRIISGQSNGNIVRIDPVSKAQTVLATVSFPLGIRVARIGVPSEPPKLEIAPAVLLSWPLRQGNFAILSSPSLGRGALWTECNVPLVVRGDKITATVEAGAQDQFFRLAQPGDASIASRLAWIPPGVFTMGSPTDELGRSGGEGPQTLVTISQGFWMGRYEVTQGEYVSVVGANPSRFTGDLNRPVEMVSWDEAVRYCELLTQRESAAGRLPDGYAYRLPTEAQWEYACRAGTSTRSYWGDDPDYSLQTSYGWQNFNSSGTTHPVGQKLPNNWGLYDMNGNVEEYTRDWWGPYSGGSVTDPVGAVPGTLMVIRGGDWNDFNEALRSAQRYTIRPGERFDQQGFRVVITRDDRRP